jgi:GTP-binding protein LepA
LESKIALGRGFRCGFLGSLHAEITARRIKEEFGLDLIITSPQVIFKVINKKGEELYISSPVDWPEANEIKEIQEPRVTLEIISPNDYFSILFKVLKNFKAEITSTSSLTKEKSLINAETALREIIRGNFYDKLKGISQGYASFNFHQIGFKKADLVKMEVLIAGQPEEAFSRIIPREDAFEEGKMVVKKLKDLLPAQQFPLAIQAAVAGRIIARETIKARRKDVTAPLYGGDVTRKKKLLKKQRKGKDRLSKERGRINLPPRVFLEMSKD